MEGYRKPNILRKMTNPCLYCPKGCKAGEDYKCDLFRVMFIIEWNETVAFLRAQLGENKEVM